MKNTVSIIGKRCAKFSEIKMQAIRIAERFEPEKIILFGSYANGNPTAESDVDLLVVIETEESALKLSSKIALFLEHSFPLDILVKTPKQIEKRLKEGDFFLKEIFDFGKILYERTDKRVD
ncbi:MAG: nucleotidyltransferase domain-containing protein [Calditrichaeota bacterium]|nr:MAG: nucleotidyltransferase domain-containing protein [Calditrichota bacterium]